MINLDILDVKYEMPPKITFIPMQIDELKVKFFNQHPSHDGLIQITRNLIYWSYHLQKETFKDDYNYIKNNVKNFTEYIDKYNYKFLINNILYAGEEKYDWGICIYFIDGDSVCINL